MADDQAKKYIQLDDAKPAYSLMAVGKLLKKVRRLNCESMESLAHALGIEVARSAKLNPKIAGTYDIREGKPVIIINLLLNAAVQEFTIAHEIAHYCLHHGRISRKLEYVEDSEANLFAYELLVKGNDPSEDNDMFQCNSDAIKMALELFLRGSMGVGRAGKSRYISRLFADKEIATQGDSQ